MAEENYFLALKYKPNHCRSLLGLATLYRCKFKKYNLAEEYYLKAILNSKSKKFKIEMYDKLATLY